jgi:hypothetical protein
MKSNLAETAQIQVEFEKMSAPPLTHGSCVGLGGFGEHGVFIISLCAGKFPRQKNGACKSITYDGLLVSVF